MRRMIEKQDNLLAADGLKGFRSMFGQLSVSCVSCVAPRFGVGALAVTWALLGPLRS